MPDLSQVPVFILAGGLGTRFSEETNLKPKPMIEIGDVPILIHIMRWYHSYGFNDFVICAGYKSWEVKDYFLNYQCRLNHLIIDHRKDVRANHRYEGGHETQEKWRVRVVDTGLETMTGSRLAMAYDFVSKTDKVENFAVTYGDGVTNANLLREFEFHVDHQKVGTMLGVPPVARFGEIAMDDGGTVQAFVEKPEHKHGLINGGFFFFKKEFREYLRSENERTGKGLRRDVVLERAPLEGLARDRQLVVFEHRGFWQCMDTLRDKNYLQGIWDSGNAPWKPANAPLR